MLHFEWDPVKAQTNHRKHKMTFETASHVFEDPDAIFEPDPFAEAELLRWRVIGRTDGKTIALVVHTSREEGEDEIVRMISARKATRQERNRYEQART